MPSSELSLIGSLLANNQLETFSKLILPIFLIWYSLHLKLKQLILKLSFFLTTYLLLQKN